METLKTIGAVAALAVCIIFLAITIVCMFGHSGPDERDECTRYGQNDKDD